MKNEIEAIEKMSQDEKSKKINRLKDTIRNTKDNIEASDEIMDELHYNAQKKKLQQQDKNRRHAIAGLKKEIDYLEGSK